MKFNDAIEDRHQAHSGLECVRDELTALARASSP